jgi:DNA-binding beta-propeller fold protein YncE
MLPSQRRALIWIAAIGILVALLAIAHPHVRRIYRQYVPNHAPSTGRLANPEGLAIDSEGTFYVGNQDSADFVILDKAGKVLKRWNVLEGYHNGKGEPSGFCRGLYIVVPEPGHVFQTAVHNLVEFDARPDPPKLLHIFGTQGEGPGQMYGPEGISRDSNGDVYATDEHNRRINVFDKSGQYLRSFTVPQDPQCVTVFKDRVYVSLDKRNYLACYTKEGVEKFRIGHEALFPLVLYVTIPLGVTSLVFLTLLGRIRLGVLVAGVFGLLALGGCLADFAFHHTAGEYRLPDYIAVSPDEKELYIVDRLNCRIQVTDLDGHFKRMFGRPGSKLGQLKDPKQLAFDPEGNLWVADSDNHRLQAFTPDGKPLRLIE